VKKRKKMNIDRVFWFYWRDPDAPKGRPACTFCPSSGLLKHNRHHKPSYKKFKHYARMQRQG
jgi:hypothetical protein